MKIDEYLQIVSEQIRYKKIRSTVTEELRNHILDQAQAYEACGAFPEEAMERAVREMGDPVDTGVALDRIHRPQMNWEIIILIALISIFSIGIFYIADALSANVYPWEHHAAFVLCGFLLMLVVYRLDYSFLARFDYKSALLFSAILIAGLLVFGETISGRTSWISVGILRISVPEAMFLYLPLFGASLYAMRGQSYGIFIKIIPLILIPTVIIRSAQSFSYAAILFISLSYIFLFAVWKEWFAISKKWVLGISSFLLLISPIVFLGYTYYFGPAYQADRIKAYFTASGNADYIARMAGKIRTSSSLIGGNQKAMDILFQGPTREFLSDYILVSMCSIYGIVLTVAIIGGLILLIMKMLKISIEQKNQLGMMIGMGCGIAFLGKTTAAILINLQMIPYMSVGMPFLSYGGSGIIVSYILLGLVLSIYRFKNILPSKPETYPRRYLKLKLTWGTR